MLLIILPPISEWLLIKFNDYTTQKTCESVQSIETKTKPGTEEKLENYISNLESLVVLKDECQQGSIRWYIQWYALRYPLHRFLYHSFGIIVLSIPLFMEIPELQGRNLFAAFITFLIGITTFFSWGTAWGGYFEAKVQLEFLMSGWKATLIEARETSDEGKAIEMVRTGFNDLLKQSNKIIIEETKSFFDSIKFPSL